MNLFNEEKTLSRALIFLHFSAADLHEARQLTVVS